MSRRLHERVGELPASIRSLRRYVSAIKAQVATGTEMTDKAGRDDAKHLIDLAHKAGVTRFVILSSVGAEQLTPTREMAHHLKPKREADEHLKSSRIAYAILRPLALINDGPGADVAHVLSEAATTGRFEASAQQMQPA